MKKSWFLFLIISLIAVSNVFAFDWKHDVKYDFESKIGSHYMWRGFRLSNAEVWQNTFSADIKDCFTAQVFANLDFDQEKINEVSLDACYRKKVGEFELAGGVHYYGKINHKDSTELYFKGTYKAWEFSDITIEPYGIIFGDVQNGKGAYLEVGAEAAMDVDARTIWAFGANVGLNIKDGFVGRKLNGEEYTNLSNGVVWTSMSFLVREWFFVEPMIGLSVPLSQNAQQTIMALGNGGKYHTFYGAVTANFVF